MSDFPELRLATQGSGVDEANSPVLQGASEGLEDAENIDWIAGQGPLGSSMRPGTRFNWFRGRDRDPESNDIVEIALL